MSDHNKKDIFVVIAAYNESSTVRHVVERLLPEYPSIVVVDDGSTDDTYQQLVDLNVFLLRHIVNRGQGASLQTGIEFALQKHADIVVTFDADGQHNEKNIDALVQPIREVSQDVSFLMNLAPVDHTERAEDRANG